MYYINNSTFVEYKFTDSALLIRDILYSSTSKQLVFYGHSNTQSIYTIHTLLESILEFDEIEQETTPIFYEANISDYQLSSVVIGNPTLSSITINDGGSLTLVNRTMSLVVDQYSDLVYYLDTSTDSEYFSLMEGWNQTLSINITCSVSGNTSLEHTIENYINYTAPTWVSLDYTNFQLYVFVPEVITSTDYHFRIKTNEYNSSLYFYKIVNMTVLN